MISIKERDFIAEAAAIGSTAKTRKGAVRALVAYRRKWPKRHLKSYRRMTKSAWLAKAADRKSYPEAKRARDDKDFRRGFIRRLKYQFEKLQPAFGIQAAIQHNNLIEEKRKRFSELKKKWSIASDKLCPFHVPELVGYAIPVSSITVESIGFKVCRIGKEWEVIQSRRPSRLVREHGRTIWRNGRPKGYTRCITQNFVRSFGVFAGENTIECVFHENIVRVTLPTGYAWGKDENGIKAYIVDSPKDDFHPSAFNLLAGAENIVKQLEHNREERRKQAARKQAEKAQLAGVWVGLNDSLRAGNCRVGTESFCCRHGLDVGKRYPAEQVYDIASVNGDFDRARLAISAAVIRHGKEMEMGFCQL